jgi:hypothetical protein
LRRRGIYRWAGLFLSDDGGDTFTDVSAATTGSRRSRRQGHRHYHRQTIKHGSTQLCPDRGFSQRGQRRRWKINANLNGFSNAELIRLAISAGGVMGSSPVYAGIINQVQGDTLLLMSRPAPTPCSSAVDAPGGDNITISEVEL